MAGIEHKNWNGSAVSLPKTSKPAGTAAEILDLIKKAPDIPIRAAGHWHSLNDCIKADGGTQILMDGFKDASAQAIRERLDVERMTVTVRAGTSLYDIAQALLPDFQLPVTPEIGNATAGSVACCGTKDSSLRGGPGQVSSTVVGMTIATPSRIEHVTEAEDPERMRLLRCSYGLLGIVLEVTFRIEPVQVVEFDFESFPLKPLPSLAAMQGSADGFLAFLEPFNNKVLVERRTIAKDATRRLTPADRLQCEWRSLLWEHLGSSAAAALSGLPLSKPWQKLLEEKTLSMVGQGLASAGKELASASKRLPLIGGAVEAFKQGVSSIGNSFLDDLLAAGLEPLHFRARRADTTILFEADRPDYFDFTFWAFPVSRWEALVPKYLKFLNDFKDFRPSLPTEIYRIARDDKSLLSVSHDEDVFTLDMVHHVRRGDDFDQGWLDLNRKFNVFAAQNGGRPLLNQTKQLTREVMTTVLQQSPGLVPGWNLLKNSAEPRLTSPYFAGLFR